MRKIAIIACILFLFTGLALAQIPTAGNVFFGYSYFNNNLSSIGRAGINGWEGSLEGKVLPFIGIVADFSGHYGSETFQGAVCPVGDPPCLPSQFSANVSEHNFLFGPRVSVKLGRFRPFAEAMAGAGHVNVNSVGTDNSFATAVGGGLDYRLARLVAWRFQGDYVRTRFFSTHQDNVRFSTGIVLRF